MSPAAWVASATLTSDHEQVAEISVRGVVVGGSTPVTRGGLALWIGVAIAITWEGLDGCDEIQPVRPPWGCARGWMPLSTWNRGRCIGVLHLGAPETLACPPGPSPRAYLGQAQPQHLAPTRTRSPGPGVEMVKNGIVAGDGGAAQRGRSGRDEVVHGVMLFSRRVARRRRRSGRIENVDGLNRSCDPARVDDLMDIACSCVAGMPGGGAAQGFLSHFPWRSHLHPAPWHRPRQFH